ncbi:MAG: protein kinase [Myxococcales bacterium]|nr:protein kinase [Myxococcales bacterium]
MVYSGPHVSGPRFGNYELLDRIAVGGMAQLWSARRVNAADASPPTVVLKRLLPHLAQEPRLVRMFLGEARRLARLHHPNIVRVLECGEVDGDYYIALEHVPGRDLAQLLDRLVRGGPPPPGLGAAIVRDLCRALAHVHDADEGPSLVHRDVNPANIMVGLTGEVKLLDFGIAKQLIDSLDPTTRSGLLRGKLGYLAPEAIDGAEIDARVDQFAAGIVLHELLTGRRLFAGRNDMQTMGLVRAARVSPPSDVNPLVPPALDRICMQALARDPQARFDSCATMAKQLGEVTETLAWSAAQTAALVRERFAGQDERELSHTQRAAPSRRPMQRGAVALGCIAIAVAVAVGPRLLHRAGRRAEVEKAAPPPPAAASVTLLVRSIPTAAMVTLDGSGHPPGRTPLTFVMPRRSAPVRVHVAASGYRDAEVTVTPSENRELSVTLLPAPRPPDHRQGPTRKPAPTRKLSPGRPTGVGAPIDPFSEP